MNERIKELAEQSMLVYRDGDILLTGWMSHIDLSEYIEKFAELIVTECLSIVDDAERGGSNEIWDNAVKFIRRDLKEHFGVEE